MNMLIIGNGFDLAHDRPTTYSDFLQFLNCILLAKDYQGDRSQFETCLDIKCRSVKQYILSSFDTRENLGTEAVWNKNSVIQEIYECLDKNVWYEYFKKIQQHGLINGKNWIDFEEEILEVINFFDHEIVNIYDSVSGLQGASANEKIKYFWALFSAKIQQEKVQIVTWFDFVGKTYQDLQDLVRCLEIYLDDCVAKTHITRYSPDIQGLQIDSVLSFNYTSIPTDIYPSLTNTHYIHGCAKSDRPTAENNMVLGVNEYWDDYEKDFRTNFNCYKKFVQRIIKETKIDYKRALKFMLAEHKERKQKYGRLNREAPNDNQVYIFGHSLDITDGDILREVIQTEGVVTTIFYRNKQQQSDQIANLSKVLGQDELLKRVFSDSPTIIFKQQAAMLSRELIGSASKTF